MSRKEDEYLIERMGKLLAEIAIIVNGLPPNNISWSYHDLPEKVRALKQAPPAAPALDAIRGAVARGWCSAENSHKEMDTTLALAIANEVAVLLQAPPAAPRVERYGDGVLVHWPEGLEQYVQVGDCVTGNLAAPPAAVPSREDLLGAIGRAWTHPTTKHMPVDVTLAVAIEKEVRDLLAAARGAK